MKISFDPAKRSKTLIERGLDFARAVEVFRGRTYDRIDDRVDYGEERVITAGLLHGRMVGNVLTAPGDARHVISMRKANEREQADGVLVRKGRPPATNPKKAISLRVDADVLDAFKAGGAGWQRRMNQALRKAMGL